MRRKPRFAHGRDNLRGDVSGKRFNTHAVEGIVARIGDGGCRNDKVTASAWGEGWKASRVRMESGSGSDVRLPRVGDVELGHRARQHFARGMHRHVALSRGFRHGTLLQSIVTGHCHRPPITEYRHRVLPQDTVTGHRHRIPQGTFTGHQLQGTGSGYRHGSLIRRSLSLSNITAAYKQRHPG